MVPDALDEYRITVGPAGISSYQSVYGKRPKLPKLSETAEERTPIQNRAVQLLQSYHKARTAKYEKQGNRQPTEIRERMFVSVHIHQPGKGQPRWRLGYKVLSSYNGALRLYHEGDSRVHRVNQKDVREIPEQKTYGFVFFLSSFLHST